MDPMGLSVVDFRKASISILFVDRHLLPQKHATVCAYMKLNIAAAPIHERSAPPADKISEIQINGKSDQRSLPPPPPPPGKIVRAFCSLLILFSISHFRKILSGIPSECQTV